MIASATLGVSGLLAVLIYALQIPAGQRWSAFATAVAVAGAAAFAGGLVGFLFGVPRALPARGPATGDEHYEDNSNLEQVSDWLSKIIVGVGLVQIGRLLPALGRLGRNLRAPLGGLPSSSAFGLALTCAYAALGFLFTYLWTRERLLPQLAAARRAMLDEAVRQAVQQTVPQAVEQAVPQAVEQAVPQAVEQAVPQAVMQAVPQAVRAATASAAASVTSTVAHREHAEFDALLWTMRQLDAGKGGTAPGPAGLQEYYAAAPPSTRLQVFALAEETRARNWMTPDGEPDEPGDQVSPEERMRRMERMEHTIGVFRALVAVDPGGEFHRFRGSLGFALKDQQPPAWADAYRELTEAIRIRDAHGQAGWRTYEANRALCGIALLDDLPPDWSRDELAATIASDLRTARGDDPAAAADPHARNMAARIPALRDWQDLRGSSA